MNTLPRPERCQALTCLAATKLALWVLFLVFVARVSLQFAQVVLDANAPIPATAWDSRLMPYKVLFLIQIIVVIALIAAIRDVGRRLMPRLGKGLEWFGFAYLGAMAARTIGAIIAGDTIVWFDMPVPTSFHVVLATLLIILGHTYRVGELDYGTQTFAPALRQSIYPVVMGAALGLFSWNLNVGLAPSIAAYHAIVLATAAIIVAELLLPYRPDWRPDRGDLVTDAAYLGLVQTLLPALVSALMLWAIAHYDLAIVNLWPDGLAMPIQVILMLLIADFGRYWLHRASHKWSPLWRLHAVHHAPEELHSLNVGRFHPLEKTIQFAFDTMPFILVGVSDTVVAGYLVFYAVNGFFQHSNVDVRLGVLNWVISGPELHRWHHAREPRLSDHNYGNNLILWDNLFSTRYLPSNENVSDLGLRNRAYPSGMLGQIAAPFTVNPNQEHTK